MPPQSPSQLDEIFFALSDQTRRGILRELAKGPSTVGHLGAPFPIAPATLSRHLSVLERAGLIEKTRDGRHLRTSLNPGPLWDTMDWLQALRVMWNDQLDALEVLLKRERRSGASR
jgi:DNA-binding transcriptional ArsR family regulator